MADDFFSDLVPIKPANGSRATVPGNSDLYAYSEDAVLSARPDAKPSAKPETPRSTDQRPAAPGSPLLPMGESRQKKEARELETTMQALLDNTMKRFAGGLQNVLEDINRRGSVCMQHSTLDQRLI